MTRRLLALPAALLLLLCAPLAASGTGKAEPPRTIREVMQGLAGNMAALQAGLWVEDWKTVSVNARAIAGHAPISSDERNRVEATLGDDTAKFDALDELLREGAERVAAAADRGEGAMASIALVNVVVTCATCHEDFRTRLGRTTPDK